MQNTAQKKVGSRHLEDFASKIEVKFEFSLSKFSIILLNFMIKNSIYFSVQILVKLKRMKSGFDFSIAIL